MKIRLRRLPRVLTLLSINVALLVLLVSAPAPRIDTTFGGASVEITADRSWTILPGQCANITWDLEGIQSLYINAEGKIGHDQMAFCPTPSATSLNFNITAASGESQTFAFMIQFMPAAIVTWLTFLVFLLPFIIAVYYLATMRLTEPSIVDWSPILLLPALLFFGLLIQTAQPATIASVLDTLGYVFTSASWHVLGYVLAGLIFVPLAIQAVRRGRQRGMRADLVAIVAFFVIVVLMYSLVGFESIGQWESWPFQAFLEGRPTKSEYEFIVRFWILVPHALASAISPDSFAGYHFVNLFMFWGLMVFFYAILRQLQCPPWLAFLATLLFLVYPVNSKLMSMRSFRMTFGKLSLLAGVYFILDCRENPSRLHLLAIWLALLFNVGSFEIALAIIVIIPLLWWRRAPRRIWRNINLTMVWYLVPIAKAAHILLMLVDRRYFYRAGVISGSHVSDLFTLDKARENLEIVASVYRRTFLDGWQEALNALSENTWIAATVVILALIGVISVYLSREADHDSLFPPPRRIFGAMLAGFLFILPSIAVLMWLSIFTWDLWRMYVYVPMGAAIAVLGLVVLVSTSIKNLRLRQVFVVCLSLLLILPGLSRLYVQQWHFEQSANAKAKILMQIVEQAPSFDLSAHLMLVTSMPRDALERHGISELKSNMFDSAIYMLYQERRPGVAFLCTFAERCSRDDTYLRHIERDFLGSGEDYSDVVMFRLHDDLRVELLRALPPELRGRDNVKYDPERLIDTSAPIPPRAYSLLASARRE